MTVVLGLDDNPKLALDEPGATLNGQPLPAWLATRRLAPEDVWPPSPAPGAGAAPAARTLWEAKLFVADAADPYRRILRWLQRPPAASAAADGPSSGPPGPLEALGLPGVRERWLAARRSSLRDLLDGSDAAALGAWREALVGDVAAARVEGDVGAGGDEDFGALFSGLTGAQRRAAQRRLEALSQGPAAPADPLQRARYWRVLAGLAAPEAVESLLDRAAAAVGEAVSRPPRAGGGAAGGALRPGRRVRVAAPVRIDFGGG